MQACFRGSRERRATRVHRALLLVAAVGVLLLGACATPYQPQGFTGGFVEKKISDSAYWVAFDGNGHTAREQVSAFWFYRCAELTVSKGYRYMQVRPGEQAPVALAEPPATRAASWDGSSQRGSIAHAVYRPVDDGDGHRVKAFFFFIPGPKITTWHSKGTVVMYPAPLPDEVVSAFDARRVLELLGPYVRSGGQPPIPNLGSISQLALVAHERVAFAADGASIVGADGTSESRAAAQAGKGADAAATPKPTRTAEEIVGQFESHSVAFHSLFRERGAGSGGSARMSFVVTPNGLTTDCRVIASDFPTGSFVDALASLVCGMTFPPRDVAPTVVRSFAITFTPLPPQGPTATLLQQLQDADYRAALAEVSPLFDRDEQPLPGTPEGDRFDVLVTLIEAYERKHFPVESADPIEAIKFAMDQRGLSPRDLEPKIGRTNRVYEILAVRRPLTMRMVRELHRQLGIPAESLIGV